MDSRLYKVAQKRSLESEESAIKKSKQEIKLISSLEIQEHIYRIHSSNLSSDVLKDLFYEIVKCALQNKHKEAVQQIFHLLTGPASYFMDFVRMAQERSDFDAMKMILDFNDQTISQYIFSPSSSNKSLFEKFIHFSNERGLYLSLKDNIQAKIQKSKSYQTAYNFLTSLENGAIQKSPVFLIERQLTISQDNLSSICQTLFPHLSKDTIFSILLIKHHINFDNSNKNKFNEEQLEHYLNASSENKNLFIHAIESILRCSYQPYKSILSKNTNKLLIKYLEKHGYDKSDGIKNILRTSALELSSEFCDNYLRQHLFNYLELNNNHQIFPSREFTLLNPGFKLFSARFVEILNSSLPDNSKIVFFAELSTRSTYHKAAAFIILEQHLHYLKNKGNDSEKQQFIIKLKNILRTVPNKIHADLFKLPGAINSFHSNENFHDKIELVFSTPSSPIHDTSESVTNNNHAFFANTLELKQINDNQKHDSFIFRDFNK